jgi:hypothetical protein
VSVTLRFLCGGVVTGRAIGGEGRCVSCAERWVIERAIPTVSLYRRFRHSRLDPDRSIFEVHRSALASVQLYSAAALPCMTVSSI